METKEKVKRSPSKILVKIKGAGFVGFLAFLFFGSFVLSVFSYFLLWFGVVDDETVSTLIVFSILFSFVFYGFLFLKGAIWPIFKKLTYYPQKIFSSFLLDPKLDSYSKKLLFWSFVSYFLFFLIGRVTLFDYFYPPTVAFVNNPFLFYSFLFVVFSVIYYRIKDSHVNGYLISGFEKFLFIGFPVLSLIVLFVFFDGLSKFLHVLFYRGF